MDSERQIDFPLPKQLRNAGITRVTVESPYLTVYCRNDNFPLGHQPVGMVQLHGSWQADRTAIAAMSSRIFPRSYAQAQLLTHLISQSEYYQTLISNDKALEKLRDTAAYEVAKSILKKPKNSTETTYNAAAATNVGIKKAWLSQTIENVIDVSSNQADRTIERLINSGKLLEIPRSDKMQESDDTIVLG